MTSDLAQKLKLPLLQREHLSVSTFGAQKATSIDTHVVSFNVQVKNGSYMMMSARNDTEKFIVRKRFRVFKNDTIE